jgi:PEP-CTERM/exosortase A-associated glycosyltransferase
VRILHVLDHSVPLHSGYTFRTLAILREQRRLGWETVHVTSPKQGEVPANVEEVDGLRFYRTTAQSWRSLPTGFAEVSLMRALAARIAEVVDAERPDVIHAHSPVLNAIPAIRVARRNRLPVVYEVRAFWEDAAVDHGTGAEWGLRYRLTRGLETWALRQADRVTTICEGLRGEIVSRGVAGEKVAVIPNAVDIGRFSADIAPDLALRARLGLQDRTVIGFIGSFYAYEGLDLLLDAMSRILREVPQAALLLVGGGPQESALKERARALGLADHVVFVGRVPHAEVQRYYNLVDVFAYPRHSMRLTELVTPLKPLEAMAQGRLLVASDVGGHRELIRDRQTGVLFKADDADALAAAVVDLIRDRASWQGLREQARSFVERERNWRTSVERYRGVYGPLVGAVA